MTATALRARVTRARSQIQGPRDVFLIVRMLCWGLMLRVLKHSVPLPTLVRFASWRTPNRSRHDAAGAERDRSTGPRSGASNGQGEQEKIVTLARWACHPMPWSDRGSCLERSLVTYRYLLAVNANPTLVIGMAPRSEAVDLIHGHAWVVVDGQPVGESAESLSGFHALMKFDVRGTGSSASL